MTRLQHENIYIQFTATFEMKCISLLFSFRRVQKKIAQQKLFSQFSTDAHYLTGPITTFIKLLADTDTQWFTLSSLCCTKVHWVLIGLITSFHTIVTCYSTALLNPKSNRSSLQWGTGVNIVFQIFILYFYLLHFMWIVLIY